MAAWYPRPNQKGQVEKWSVGPGLFFFVPHRRAGCLKQHAGFAQEKKLQLAAFWGRGSAVPVYGRDERGGRGGLRPSYPRGGWKRRRDEVQGPGVGPGRREGIITAHTSSNRYLVPGA